VAEASTSRSLAHSLSTWKQNFQKSHKDQSAQRLTSSLKDKRERISIILSLFLLWTQFCSIILLDIQERKKSVHRFLSTQSIKRDSEQFMPIQFQLLLQLALEQTLLSMASAPSSWPFRTSLSLTRILILPLVSATLELPEET
jgi:hypothetical protein